MRKMINVLCVIVGLMASTTSLAQNECTCVGIKKGGNCGRGYIGGDSGRIHSNIKDSELGSYLDPAALETYKSNKLAWSTISGWQCTTADAPMDGWFDVITYNIHGNCGHGGICAKEKRELGRALQQDLVNDRTILALQEDWRYNGYTSGFLHDVKKKGYEKFPKGETCNDPEHTRTHINLPYQSRPQLRDPCPPSWNDGLNLFSAFPFVNSVGRHHPPTTDARGITIIDQYRETYRAKSTMFSFLGIKIPVGADKGFTLASVEIDNNLFIDVYTTHAGDYGVRKAQFAQLTNKIKAISDKGAEPNPVIVAGDTNLVWLERFRKTYPNSGPEDINTFETFLKENRLQSACKIMGTCPDGIDDWPFPAGLILDQIMFRGNSFYSLTPVGFQQVKYPFSDHQPIRVRFAWRRLKPYP